ncbi:hypothetical protein NM208_g8204 [Fusarium decemcellulare]|uniref:Uncharacterized protein n=1 Tax=Fusarium decemcellulare TaxID=57161 RepID=A0ACC1S6E2_9HYPO|nr:hypothetical protein NM208_g8204 [Fusarium decemcellulare]
MKLLNYACWAIFSIGSASAGTLQCDDVAVKVSATASRKAIPADLNLTDAASDASSFPSLLNGLPEVLSSGTFTIRATLQILVHGITFTRHYWTGSDGDGNLIGSEYSWQEYAAAQGYATFAVDRLCNGKSSKPDGALFCQLPFQAEVLNQVIEQARAGALGGVKYSKVIYAGHSLGSLVGNVLGQRHPEAVDAYMLTGYTPFLNKTVVGVVLAGPFIPAILADPLHFVSYALDPTYLGAASSSGTEGIFYDGEYDKAVAEQQFDTRGTSNLGEALTALDGSQEAPGVKVPVMALNGQQDQIFCGANSLDLVAGGHKGNCGTGDSSITAKSGNAFPNAQPFEWHNVAETGHNNNFHRTAQLTFKAAHDFFARHGF